LFDNLPVAVDLPFRFENGQIATNRDVDRQIRQRLIAIIGTNPTERIMLPNLGVGVARFVFEPDPAQVTSDLTTEIKNQAARYEPGATIVRVIPRPNAKKGEAILDIEYERTDTPDSNRGSRFVHMAAIGPGGIVHEVIRG